MAKQNICKAVLKLEMAASPPLPPNALFTFIKNLTSH